MGWTIDDKRAKVVRVEPEAPLFVMGTGPGVGKTLVATGLLTALGARGVAAVGIKPVETGCAHDDTHDLVGADGARLREAAPTKLPPLVTSPYRFAPAVSPAIAAEQAGLELRLDDLTQAVDAGRAFGRVVVEGPGGPLCPVASDGSTADLAARLRGPVLLVARDQLGADGDVLLAIEACARRGLALRGVVLSRRDADGTGWSNEASIASRTEVPVFTTLPPLSGDEVRQAAAHLEAAGALDALLA